MLLKRTKNIIKVTQKRPKSRPKTGKFLQRCLKYPWLIWLFPIVGLLSLIWFLIRVLPKPSRATYPCQRVAAPLAFSFVAWAAGIIGSTLAYRKARRLLHQSRYVLAAISVAVAVMAIWWSLSITADSPAHAEFIPSDPPNTPIGIAKGIHPGRVVWTHDPCATSWNGTSGKWWDDNNTDQQVVDSMISKTLQGLTGQPNDSNAWDALFRHSNQSRGLSDIGYQAGEKITIKINMNQDTGGAWSAWAGMPSPHMIYSVLDQLINVIGVSGSDITVYDASRYIGDPIYDKVRGNPDPNFQNITFIVRPDLTGSGRIAASYDSGNPLYTTPGTAYLPQCVTQANYIINMALLRPHTLYGITLCAKNNFGSTYFPTGGGWTPSPLHNYGLRGNPMGSYNCLVNLNGHRHLWEKTMLFMIDGLYPAIHQSGNVLRWLSFDNDWCSSIFASQDPVAIDSVGLDFMRNEPLCTDVTGNPDNYLHEAALADNPPSGTFYDPEGDGTRLDSLGVHEHWNNAIEKQYSRNLGIDDGIELVIKPPTSDDGPVENLNRQEKYDYINYAINYAQSGHEIVISPGIYHENVDFKGKNLKVRSTDPNDPAIIAATIINGGGNAPVVTFTNGEDPNSVITGLTITNGNGGIDCNRASPKIINCIIYGNSADSFGGGICCRQLSNPEISNCIITGNSAPEGGGIYYEAQTIPPAPASTDTTLASTDCTITNCVITGNTANYGGGVFNEIGNPNLFNCTISGNSAAYQGGGLFSDRLTNPTIKNCILWDNTPDQIINEWSMTVTYSDVQGTWPGEGNIDNDPCFADANNGDYHLKSQAGRWDPVGQTWITDANTSPCIDAGDPNSDWTAELWPHGKRINIGAYGGTPQASMSLSDVGNIADLDNNDVVNFIDFAHFSNGWKIEEFLKPEDLDRNGSVDIFDLAIFAENWLSGYIQHWTTERRMKLRLRIVPSPPLKCVLLLRGHYEG